MQAVGRVERVAASGRVAGPHRPERLPVDGEGPSPGEVSAGGGEPGAPEPGQERTDQKHGSPQLSHEAGVRLVVRNVPALDTDGGRAEPLDRGAQAAQQLPHDRNIADPGHVGQLARLGGEETGRQQRKSGVLVPFDVDAPSQSVAALDDEPGLRPPTADRASRYENSPR